jgi:hypothetical protein
MRLVGNTPDRSFLHVFREAASAEQESPARDCGAGFERQTQTPQPDGDHNR